jgi:hypothetical protein
MIHELGIEAPAQAIYALRLVGYQIDGVSLEKPNGREALDYRLSPMSEDSAQEVPDRGLRR